MKRGLKLEGGEWGWMRGTGFKFEFNFKID
jgi:hypothetical protein